MGTFIALEGAEDSFEDLLLKSIVEAQYQYRVISLRTLRRYPSEGDVSQIVLGKVSELFRNPSVNKQVFLILDKFDVWTRILPQKEQRDVDNPLGETDWIDSTQPSQGHDKLARGPWDKLRNSIVQEKDIETKFAKTKLSSVYKLLYFLRYSVAYRLRDHGCRLVCLATHANEGGSREFYSDIFHHTYEIVDFLHNQEDLQLGLKLPRSWNSQHDVDLASINNYINSRDPDTKGTRVYLNPLYHLSGITIRRDRLIAEIPFDVKCSRISLSQVNFICGEQGSGKKTLLNAILQAWLEGAPAQIVPPEVSSSETQARVVKEKCNEYDMNTEETPVESTLSDDREGKNSIAKISRSAYKLELYRVLSQFVGCGESFIRQTFQKARNNKPSLVVIDDLGVLFQEENAYEGNSAVLSTLVRTLINEIRGLTDGVAFIASTSGKCTSKMLPLALTSLPHTVIFLKKEDSPL